MRILLDFRNEQGSELNFWLEPWGQSFSLSPGDSLSVRYTPKPGHKEPHFDLTLEKNAVLAYLDFHYDELVIFKNDVEVRRLDPFLDSNPHG